MALKPCPRCGKMISDKAERCPQCGLDVKNLNSAQNPQNQQPKSRPTIIDKPLPQGQPTIIEEHSQYGNPTYVAPPKKSRTGLWICLGIILAVGIGAAIWIPVHRHNEKLKAEHLALLEQQRLDSIAAVEAELARLEQIRQDSIELEQYKQSIDNQFVTPKDIFASYKNGGDKGLIKTLKEKGYKLIKTERYEEPIPGDEDDFWINERTTYALESTNPEYPVWNKVITDTGGNGWESICDIEFCDEEHLQSFIQQSLKLGLKKEKYGNGYEYSRHANNYNDCWNLYRSNNKPLTLNAHLP